MAEMDDILDKEMDGSDAFNTLGQDIDKLANNVEEEAGESLVKDENEDD